MAALEDFSHVKPHYLLARQFLGYDGMVKIQATSSALKAMTINGCVFPVQIAEEGQGDQLQRTVKFPVDLESFYQVWTTHPTYLAQWVRRGGKSNDKSAEVCDLHLPPRERTNLRRALETLQPLIRDQLLGYVQNPSAQHYAKVISPWWGMKIRNFQSFEHESLPLPPMQGRVNIEYLVLQSPAGRHGVGHVTSTDWEHTPLHKSVVPFVIDDENRIHIPDNHRDWYSSNPRYLPENSSRPMQMQLLPVEEKTLMDSTAQLLSKRVIKDLQAYLKDVNSMALRQDIPHWALPVYHVIAPSVGASMGWQPFSEQRQEHSAKDHGYRSRRKSPSD